MTDGKEAARDLVYGRRGGRWAQEQSPPMSELKAEHLASGPRNCKCRWHQEHQEEAVETADEEPTERPLFEDM